jgi:hypothetical protein
MGRRLISFFEIGILILGTIAFGYLIGETNSYFDDNGVGNEESDFVGKSREVITLWFERSKIGIVSAQGQEGLWTCLEDVNGSICQEYPAEICDENCVAEGGCFQGRRDDYGECRLGTCFDSETGECQPNTPRAACEDVGGEWSEESPPQCAVECCLINPYGDGFADQTQYSTEQACNYISETVGIDVEWVSVENEIECLLLAGAQEEGACILGEIPGEGFECRFGGKSFCLNSGGEFHKDFLCSAEENLRKTRECRMF